MNPRLLVANCGQLVTCRHTSASPKTGDAMKSVDAIADGAIIVEGEKIVWVGEEARIPQQFKENGFADVIDAGGRVVTPGLVDPHTHPVFAATREDEFFLRNAGKSYMEIAQAGGGIRNSARKLRATSKEQLLENGILFLNRMLRSGTTTIEAKSGYGLTTESEIKSLEVIAELDRKHPIDLIPTFLGAHEFPDEYRENREGYVDLLIKEMIPEVARRKLARFCDIFTEEGVFDVEQSRRIMTAARNHGFGLKFHADELRPTGGAELAAELGAVSADHLVHISEKGIETLARAGTIAVLLPATTFFLGHTRYAPARRMIDAGVPVAIATDFNPGSSCTTSLTAAMTIAAIYLKMTAAEIMNAVTYNSACALELQTEIGSLEAGKLADFVIWDADSYAQLPYFFAQNTVLAVYKRGRKVA